MAYMHTARRVGLVLTRALAVVAHLLLGPAIYFGGFLVHPAVWVAGLLWLVGLFLIVRWWRGRPGRVVAVPLVLAALYVGGVLVVEELGVY